jgi:hypothetical protein
MSLATSPFEPYPTTFAAELQPLPADLGVIGNQSVSTLAEKDYVVMTGLPREYAGDIATMGSEQGIVKYCYKDETDKRFATEESTGLWLGKGDPEVGIGRSTFLLMKDLGDKGLQLAGYGWTGYEAPEPPEEANDQERELFAVVMKGLKTTFAVRIGQDHAGNGLAVPFTNLITIGSNVKHGAKDFWLETWKSNHAAGVYAKAGWEKMPIEIAAKRKDVRSGTKIDDIRTFYSYPNDKLPA